MRLHSPPGKDACFLCGFDAKHSRHLKGHRLRFVTLVCFQEIDGKRRTQPSVAGPRSQQIQVTSASPAGGADGACVRDRRREKEAMRWHRVACPERSEGTSGDAE